MHVLVNNTPPKKNPTKKPKHKKKNKKPKTEQYNEKLKKNKILKLNNKRDAFLFVLILYQTIRASCMQDL